MDKKYSRPVILSNEELAEGVYAGSGAGNNASWSKTGENFWSDLSGQTTFSIKISSYPSSHCKVTVTFNKDVDGAYGGNANVTVSKNIAVLDMWNPEKEFSLTAQTSNGKVEILAVSVEEA